MIHFIAQHYLRILAAWFVLSVALLFLWAILFGETPEQRANRKSRDRERLQRERMRQLAALYEQRRLARARLAQVKNSEPEQNEQVGHQQLGEVA